MSIIERGFPEGHNSDGGDATLIPVKARGGHLSEWIGAIGLLFVVAALFGLVGFHARIAEEQTVLDGLEDQLVDVRVENDRLQLAVAQLESPSRIVDTARGSLGMTKPEKVIYLTPPAELLTPEEVRDAFLGRTFRWSNDGDGTSDTGESGTGATASTTAP